MTKNKAVSAVLMVVFLIILIAMFVQLLPLLTEIIENRRDESSVVQTVNAFGWRGPPALVALAALQVIIPLIPAPAIGVLTGLSYGVYWGPLIFLGGIALGNLFVIFSVRQLDSFIVKIFKRRPDHSGPLSKEKLEKIKKPEYVAFFLFMIPFLSGVGPYLFAETKVSIWKYLAAVVLGSIPQTIIYVFLGDRISQGNYTTAIITGAIVVVAIIFVLIFRKKLMAKIMDEYS